MSGYHGQGNPDSERFSFLRRRAGSAAEPPTPRGGVRPWYGCGGSAAACFGGEETSPLSSPPIPLLFYPLLFREEKEEAPVGRQDPEGSRASQRLRRGPSRRR